MGDWIMTTGAGLPFERELLNEAKKEFSESFDSKGLLVAANEERLLELERFLLREAFEAGCSLEIEYQ